MQKFEPIRNDSINSKNTLSELFDLWRTEHENDDAFRQYEKRGVEKTSFECDGIINEKKYKKQKSKVLFIAKEGNMGGRDTNAVVNKTDDSFWFREVVEGKNKRNLFARRIIMLCNALSSGYYDKVDSRSLDAMSGAAFMNLNKRGGYRYCDWNVLEAYTIRFSEYIRKEVNLIDPDIIVCCGRGVEYLLREYVFKDSCNIPKLIEVYHPSYFKIPNIEYLRLFYTELCEKGIISESHIEPAKDSVFKCDLSSQKNFDLSRKNIANDIPICKKGVIIDTNEKNNSDATGEMLSRTPYAKISAFGESKNCVKNLNIDDYVFYYLNNTGIIAVGRVISDAQYNADADECYRDVEIIVEPVLDINSEYIGVRLTKALRNRITNVNKRFVHRGTAKKPYFSEDEMEKAKNYISEKLTEHACTQFGE